ncbi:MAG: 4Fe-4S dicluster domain-containing protein, partial [Jatrophihabitantaceae bacterium]
DPTGTVFGHSAGPQSFKQVLHPARQQLWSTERDTGEYLPAPIEDVRHALLGVHGCDLAAIQTLVGVLNSEHPDQSFASRHSGLFIVAVGCTEPGELCFCASVGTGPAPGPGYDLALTERLDESGHWFAIEAASPAGEGLLARLNRRPVTDHERETISRAVTAAAGRMGRQLPLTDVRALLRDNRESPHWQQVAERCLTCGNCTMVCPTCFCTTTEDVTDLTGDHAERWQRWASCFELDFSYIHGGSVRTSGASRYRQWITHKLSSWTDQFGGTGCVGCGRCIAWCPPGIDIVAELHALAAEDG